MSEPLHAITLQASFTVADLEHSTTWSADVLGFAVDRRHERDASTLGKEPPTMPWGPRIIRFRDPDGFRFTLSSSQRSECNGT